MAAVARALSGPKRSPAKWSWHQSICTDDQKDTCTLGEPLTKDPLSCWWHGFSPVIIIIIISAIPPSVAIWFSEQSGVFFLPNQVMQRRLVEFQNVWLLRQEFVSRNIAFLNIKYVLDTLCYCLICIPITRNRAVSNSELCPVGFPTRVFTVGCWQWFCVPGSSYPFFFLWVTSLVLMGGQSKPKE